MDHICDIGEKCGFSVQEDKLRIPSTKRICFIGIHDSQKSIDSDLLQTLDKNFVPRPSEELVRIYYVWNEIWVMGTGHWEQKYWGWAVVDATPQVNLTML